GPSRYAPGERSRRGNKPRNDGSTATQSFCWIFIFSFSKLGPVQTGRPPPGRGGSGLGVSALPSIWDPNSRTGVPSWVVAGFDGHEMAGIQGQNLVMVGEPPSRPGGRS